jgi:hypothetical protein
MKLLIMSGSRRSHYLNLKSKCHLSLPAVSMSVVLGSLEDHLIHLRNNGNLRYVKLR